MGPIGFQEMVLIFIVALLIFGPKKLPELGRSFGKGVAEFRKASAELRSTFQREMDNIDRETQDVKKTADDLRKDVHSSYYDDSGDYYADHDEATPEKSDSSANGSSSPSAVADNGGTTETPAAEPGASDSSDVNAETDAAPQVKAS
jgi:sec-independent protein translocase protein TatA